MRGAAEREQRKRQEVPETHIAFQALLTVIWRSGWDSNPRAIARKLISSQPRYDHFDTAASIICSGSKTRETLYHKTDEGARKKFCKRNFKKSIDKTVDPCYYDQADGRCGDDPPLVKNAGVAQWSGHQPSKLGMRVRFPSPAPSYAPVAQLDRATAF